MILHVEDVDAVYARAIELGYDPRPRLATQLGGGFFHLRDPDGHELSFAAPAERNRRGVAPR